jgi:hypothetical protein
MAFKLSIFIVTNTRLLPLFVAGAWKLTGCRVFKRVAADANDREHKPVMIVTQVAAAVYADLICFLRAGNIRKY